MRLDHILDAIKWLMFLFLIACYLVAGAALLALVVAVVSLLL